MGEEKIIGESIVFKDLIKLIREVMEIREIKENWRGSWEVGGSGEVGDFL